MAREEVTFEEVAAAAAGLQKDGEPVTVEAVRDILGEASANVVYRHLALWRAHEAEVPEPPRPELPSELLDSLARWAQQYAQEAGAPARDTLTQSESDLEALRQAGEALESERDDLLEQIASLTIARDQAEAGVAERDATIERLNAELSDARQVAMDALVSKAKDQLAIDGKENQLVNLRAQLERQVASQASESDARLAAQMELVGATTARDKFSAEAKDLRAQLDAIRAERSTMKAELDALRAKRAGDTAAPGGPDASSARPARPARP